ncbi:MAG: heme exporter protein CcmB [Dehalococcoidia bacterium]|nr:MAG: heme exporter protein CcmB [Dehalococcoidia bacterium]
MKSSFWVKVSAILWKDVLTEFRTRDTFTSVLVFSILVIVIFNFTFDPGSQMFETVAPGVLWVTFTFAGVLSLNRSFARDKEKGCLDGLVLCPADRVALYLGKMLSCLAFMLVVEAIVLPVFAVLFDLPLYLPKLAVIAVVATIGFAAVGTVFSALVVHTRARELLLPLLFFPIIIPVIIAAVKASELALSAASWSEMTSWLTIIAAFDVIFTVAAALVFDYVLEE